MFWVWFAPIFYFLKVEVQAIDFRSFFLLIYAYSYKFPSKHCFKLMHSINFGMLCIIFIYFKIVSNFFFDPLLLRSKGVCEFPKFYSVNCFLISFNWDQIKKLCIVSVLSNLLSLVLSSTPENVPCAFENNVHSDVVW